MKQPTDDITRVPHDVLRAFVHAIARKVNIPEESATLLSRLLIECDLRGTLSHGSQQIIRYAREITSGTVNARPNVQCLNETPNSFVMEGDGGLGYFPAYHGTLKLIEKANAQGMAAMVTRNHGHIGAAGIYTRLTAKHDLISFFTSGVQLDLSPGEGVYRAGGGSPMSFSAPGASGPPIILDVGVTHDVQGNAPQRDAIAALAPGMVLRAIGYGTICQAWGGLLTGLAIDPARSHLPYSRAHQGAMLFAVKISLFTDPVRFKHEIDEFARQVSMLTPMAGSEGSYLPGHVEVEREKKYREVGIPLSVEHRQDLEKIGREHSVPTPW